MTTTTAPGPFSRSSAEGGPSRRTVLRGAAVSGAALWAVPVVQVLPLNLMSAAHASTVTTPPPPPPPGGGEPLPPVLDVEDLPSHGIVGFTVQTVLYVVQLLAEGEPPALGLETVKPNAKSPDRDFLQKTVGGPFAPATWQDGSTVPGITTAFAAPGADGVVRGYSLTLPAGAALVGAWTVDGRKDAAGLDHAPAAVSGQTVHFTKSA